MNNSLLPVTWYTKKARCASSIHLVTGGMRAGQSSSSDVSNPGSDGFFFSSRQFDPSPCAFLDARRALALAAVFKSRRSLAFACCRANSLFLIRCSWRSCSTLLSSEPIQPLLLFPGVALLLVFSVRLHASDDLALVEYVRGLAPHLISRASFHSLGTFSACHFAARVASSFSCPARIGQAGRTSEHTPSVLCLEVERTHPWFKTSAPAVIHLTRSTRMYSPMSALSHLLENILCHTQMREGATPAPQAPIRRLSFFVPEKIPWYTCRIRPGSAPLLVHV